MPNDKSKKCMSPAMKEIVRRMKESSTMRNKARRQAKHAKRHPNDTAAARTGRVGVARRNAQVGRDMLFREAESKREMVITVGGVNYLHSVNGKWLRLD